MSQSVPSKKLLRMWSQNLPEKAVEDIRGAFQVEGSVPSNFRWKPPESQAQRLPARKVLSARSA